MSLYGHAYRKLWRLRAGRTGQEIFKQAAAMVARERLPADTLAAYQLERLRALLDYAYHQVPFWRARMNKAGLEPGRVTSLEDLALLPPLTKEEVRAYGEELIAEPYRDGRARPNVTGGSTGVPLRFWLDDTQANVARASKLRYRRWYGHDFGERVLYLWGAHRDTRIHGLRGWLRRRLRQEQWINAFHLTPAKMAVLAETLSRWRPDLVVAYPSAIQAFARFVRQKGLSVYAPRAIECSAEKLWPEQRLETEAALHAPVFDVYGSREFGTIAAECPSHAGLHIFVDLHIVEVICNGRPARPGEVGEILVTCLTNYAMPFIRYRIGDLGILSEEQCSCGRTLPLFKEVVGRSNAVLSLPDGTVVHGAFFSYFFYHQPGVERYRVHQRTQTSVEVLVQGDHLLTSERLTQIEQELEHRLEGQIQVHCHRVEQIDPLPSGKLGYMLSEISVDFANIPS